MGVDAVADGGVFGGEAEGVEAHGVEDVEALHSPEAGVGVGGGHDVPVADVEVTGGVGVHGKLVPLGAGVVVGGVVDAVLLPPLLPLVVDFLGRVSNVNASCGGHFWVLRPAVGFMVRNYTPKGGSACGITRKGAHEGRPYGEGAGVKDGFPPPSSWG